jgi:hypothetical protein
MQPVNCPMCESKAEVFATGASEYYGNAWQTYGVRCTGEKNQYCDMEVSIIADYSYFDVHDDTVIQLWNTVANCRNNV